METPDTALPLQTTHPLRLYKKEKLCSVIAISQLFGRERPKGKPRDGMDIHTAMAYPLRCVWRENPRRRSDAPIQFLISVPKKRLKHAVDRVLMRRRIREAFRLHRSEYSLPVHARVDVAFVYIGNGIEKYTVIEHAMTKLLKNINKNLITT